MSERVIVSIYVHPDATEAVTADVDQFADLLAVTHEVNVSIGHARVCRVCGCTDGQDCLGGCARETPAGDICSQCAPAEHATPSAITLSLPNVLKVDPSAPLAKAPTLNPHWRRTTRVECPACDTSFEMPTEVTSQPMFDASCAECGHRWTQVEGRSR